MSEPRAAADEPTSRRGEAAADEPPRAFASAERQDREALAAVALRSLPRPSRLAAKLTSLRGVGPKLADAAADADVQTLGDLLLRLPHSYRDRADVAEAADLKIGQKATLMVEVRQPARLIRTRRRNLRIVEATVADASGPLKATWFNQAWLAEKLVPGARLLIAGKLDRSGFRVETHELLGGAAAAPEGLHTTGIVPVHPATERLRAQKVREWAWQVRGLVVDVIEPLPAAVRFRHGLPSAADALDAAHFPQSLIEAELARERLAFEELVLHQVALAQRRSERRASRPGVPLEPAGELVSGWVGSLPFALTTDQRRAVGEIDADLGSDRPMQRLLMGEVGSGKTAVALAAILRCVESGAQAALMAPTETLAEQHFTTLQMLLGGTGVSPAFLSGSTTAAAKRALLGHLASGQAQIVVGTHALIEPEVRFQRLALAVVDEQH